MSIISIGTKEDPRTWRSHGHVTHFISFIVDRMTHQRADELAERRDRQHVAVSDRGHRDDGGAGSRGRDQGRGWGMGRDRGGHVIVTTAHQNASGMDSNCERWSSSTSAK